MKIFKKGLLQKGHLRCGYGYITYPCSFIISKESPG